MLKNFLHTTLVAPLLLTTGCQAATSENVENYPSQEVIETVEKDGFHVMNFHDRFSWNVMVDPDTGCQYINSGMSGYTGMMSPRIAKDGVTHMGCGEL